MMARMTEDVTATETRPCPGCGHEVDPHARPFIFDRWNDAVMTWARSKFGRPPKAAQCRVSTYDDYSGYSMTCGCRDLIHGS